VLTIAVANPLRAINRLVYSVPLVQSQTNLLFLMDNLWWCVEAWEKSKQLPGVSV